VNARSVGDLQSPRGRKPDTENHKKVAEIIKRHQPWRTRESVRRICEELDSQRIPTPGQWKEKNWADRPIQNWVDALHLNRSNVLKALEYRLQLVRRLQKVRSQT